MNPAKKQELLFKRLQSSNNLTKEYILNQVEIRNKRIYEIELDIEHIKVSKSMQVRYIEQFKTTATPSHIQKIVAKINIPTLQMNMAGIMDALYEIIDQLKEEIEFYNNILININDE